LKFTDEDIAILRRLLPVIERRGDDIVDDFYEHLLQFEDAVSFFSDQESLQRAKAAQREYLLDLFRGTYDEAYFERRLQIGVVHERIRLPAKWYISSNSIFLQILVPLLEKEYLVRPWQLTRAIIALEKVMNLDQQLVMDTYIGTMVEKVGAVGDEIKRAVAVLAPTAEKATELAEFAAESAGKAVEISEQGATTVRDALDGITSLKTRVLEASQKAGGLTKQITQIETVMSLIVRFTQHTNVLALNAEVQAARAGEHGVAFNVIASEIRKLADESKASLEQVQKLVNDVELAVEAILDMSKENAHHVESVTTQNLQIGDAFGNLADSAQEAARHIREIASSVKHQADAILRLQSLASEA
jgi:heme-based aerotactic transducer